MKRKDGGVSEEAGMGTHDLGGRQGLGVFVVHSHIL